MKLYIIHFLFVFGLLWWPFSVVGETLHCGIEKTPYDPNIKGCCLHGDGTGELTDYPDNADLENFAEGKNYCEFPNGRGVTFCYNGVLKSVVCDDNWGSLTNCIAKHEEIHRTDPNAKCHDCQPTEYIYSTKKDADDGDCKAWKASKECLESYPSGTPGRAVLLQEAEDGIAACCSSPPSE